MKRIVKLVVRPCCFDGWLTTVLGRIDLMGTHQVNLVEALAVAGFLVLGAAAPGYAAKESPGASATAYEHASDEAIFYRVGDWFATLGKSNEEKQAAIAERRARRLVKRTQENLEQHTEAAQRGIEEGANNLKKTLGQ